MTIFHVLVTQSRSLCFPCVCYSVTVTFFRWWPFSMCLWLSHGHFVFDDDRFPCACDSVTVTLFSMMTVFHVPVTRSRSLCFRWWPFSMCLWLSHGHFFFGDDFFPRVCDPVTVTLHSFTAISRVFVISHGRFVFVRGHFSCVCHRLCSHPLSMCLWLSHG